MQVDIPAVMHSVFPCFLPPRNPKGVSGWLMRAGRMVGQCPGLAGEVQKGQGPAPSFLCERGQSATHTRSSVFQSYMWETQESLKHESAQNVSFLFSVT